MNLRAFKAYDVRGRMPDELNPELVETIGRAFVDVVGAKRVVVGHDIRLSSPELAKALMRGLTLSGADVFDIGLCGTEEVYFATSHLHADGGIMVTASHNPKDYNGLKFVRRNSVPISGDSGLKEIAQATSAGRFSEPERQGSVDNRQTRADYVECLLKSVDRSSFKPLKIVVNAGNGCAGLVIDALSDKLPFDFVRIHHQPDGNFPNGIPNPLLPENRSATAQAVRTHGAAMGIAWDGDFDRCFFFDENGDFIEGYYIVGLLAAELLRAHPAEKIIYDPRTTWNTIDLVKSAGGIPVQCKSGHAFIKERMREENALYGGEMSAHHYFRDFFYCDSGMIPWLHVAAIVSQKGPLSKLVSERITQYPASGEINRRVAKPKEALNHVQEHYLAAGGSLDKTDGISIEMPSWRFNLRMSNTEPFVRLNVESRGNIELMRQKTDEVLQLLAPFEAA